MRLDEEWVTVDTDRPPVAIPGMVRLLRRVLLAQAAVAATGAVVAIAFRRDASHLGYGTYGLVRTQTTTVVLVGLFTVAAAAWLAHLLPRRLASVGWAILAIEVVFLLDFIISLFGGAFTVWLMANLLLTVVAIWSVRTPVAQEWLRLPTV